MDLATAKFSNGSRCLLSSTIRFVCVPSTFFFSFPKAVCKPEELAAASASVVFPILTCFSLLVSSTLFLCRDKLANKTDIFTECPSRMYVSVRPPPVLSTCAVHSKTTQRLIVLNKEPAALQ